MVDSEEVSIFKYNTRRIVVLRGRWWWALTFYALLLAWVIYGIGFSLFKDEHYLYRTDEIGAIETKASGYAVGKTPDGATMQYYDVGDLVYPNSADSPSLFIAANITYTEKQTQMYWNIRKCLTNSDCKHTPSIHDSGVTGFPIRSEECYSPTGFCRDLTWWPTMQQNNRTYLINDFSKITVNVVPHSEIYTRKGDKYRMYGSVQRLNVQKLIQAYAPNIAVVQQQGVRISVDYIWEWSFKDTKNNTCKPEVHIRSKYSEGGSKVKTSNSTTKQKYVYKYQIEGRDTRDEYQVVGVFLDIKSTVKIKQVDPIPIVNYAPFLFVCMVVIHAILEILLRNNPCLQPNQIAQLEASKYEKQADLQNSLPSFQDHGSEENMYKDNSDEYEDSGFGVNYNTKGV